MKRASQNRIRVLAKERREIAKRVIDLSQDKVLFNRSDRPGQGIEFDLDWIAYATLIEPDLLRITLERRQGESRQRNGLLHPILRFHYIFALRERSFTDPFAYTGNTQSLRVQKCK